MKVPQLSTLVTFALFGAGPVDAAAAKCRLPTPSSSSISSSASASPTPVQPPSCSRNYINNNYFTSSADWTFGGDASTSSSCVTYPTCGQMNADAGPATISQTFDIVPGYTFRLNLPFMYTTQPPDDADRVTCELTSGSMAYSIVLPFYTLNTYWAAGQTFTPPASTATLTCTLTSADTGTVSLAGMTVYWNSLSCAG
ncbi:hypothetical protein SBRCBS47491_001571 [Sporothrix bragantina]|uniref:Ig-like domain-containing protein n=1 Tax=Sporothrix bragantina TaxID=671064 RepID=A0ABP0AZV9_9PEZI